MDIGQKLVHMITSELLPKDFSTGSKGFYASAKITAGGVRYQCQAQAVLVGSKNDATAVVDATAEEMGAALAGVLGALKPRTFKSGRTGYRAAAKVEVRGQLFQSSIQAVRLV
ncbi:hypothetical protein ACGFIV_31120 [Sphaerisporangium sp. NPDC049003]|uniref:hypothetical protein n=1 Tax=Sphaerisporangium sp. NPDC049003 TaxID=3364517 RepID=UPI00371681AD